MAARELEQGREGQPENDDAHPQQEQQDPHHHVDPPEPSCGDGNHAPNAHVDGEVGCQHNALGCKGAALVGAGPQAFIPNLQLPSAGSDQHAGSLTLRSLHSIRHVPVVKGDAKGKRSNATGV